MTRERLPERRRSTTYSLRYRTPSGTLHYHVTLGRYGDGSVGEIFVDVQKTGSPLKTQWKAWAMQTSASLQYGEPVASIVDRYKGLQGTPGVVVGSPIDGYEATGAHDALARLLEVEA